MRERRAIKDLAHFYKKMPASQAYSSSSGGAACPGATWGQTRGSIPGVRG